MSLEHKQEYTWQWGRVREGKRRACKNLGYKCHHDHVSEDRLPLARGRSGCVVVVVQDWFVALAGD